MTIGIGLGSFVSGLDAGMRLGTGLRDANQKRQQQNAIKDITADAKNKYGDVMSDDAYDYMMKRKYALYMENGDLDKASRIKDWAQKSTSRKGTKLFGSIAAALNAGDYETAAKLGNELSKLDGYGPNGDYEFQFTQHPTQGDGFYVKTPNGDAFVPRDNALPFFTRHFNPDAAAAWHAEQGKESKALEKEAQSIRSDAIKALEKQYDGGLDGSEKRFKDLSDEEREDLINKYARERIAPGRRKKFEAYFGGSEKSKGKERSAPGLLVDQVTGDKVKTPRSEATEKAAPGSDGSIVKGDLPPLEGSAGKGVPSPSAGPGSTTTPELSRNREVMGAVEAAEEVMRTTKDVQKAAKTLRDANVPEGYWPRDVRRALKSREPTGLGQSPSRRPNPHPDRAPGLGLS